MTIVRFAGRLACIACAAALAAGWAGLPAAGGAAENGTATVAVTAIVEHPSLDAVREGLRETLAAGGYVEGQTLHFLYESAQGSPATAVQIARQFIGQRPDVIVPISTPSAQAVVAATRDLPVVFSAVTDPVAAQLVRDPGQPGGNVTGLSDLSPLAEQLDLIRELMPAARTIGVPYNPGEANSVALVRSLAEMGDDWAFTVVEAPAPRSADVQGAARSLIGRVDLIYVPTDNTIVSALEAVLAIGRDNRLPVFAADTDSVARGAVATVGFDYREVGRQTGRLVIRVLRGESPGDIPVANAQGTDLVVNLGAARAMGVDVPEAVLARASRRIE